MTFIGEPNLTVHLSMKRVNWIELHRLALSLGCTHGDRPSISRMLREIVAGNLTVVPTNRLISIEHLHVVSDKPVTPAREDDRDVEGSRKIPQKVLPPTPVPELLPEPPGDDESDQESDPLESADGPREEMP